MKEHLRGITLEPQPGKLANEWHVVVTYPPGLTEQIAGFRSENEAASWITSFGQQRLWKREY